jgi:hypothetical protein
MTTEHQNRSTDRSSHVDIADMIAAENDPKQRAFLIVMQAMNLNLTYNTASTREVSSKLDRHLQHFEERSEREDARINKARGMWKIIAWFLGVAQLGVVSLWININDDLNDLKSDAGKGHLSDVRIEMRLDRLEGKP